MTLYAQSYAIARPLVRLGFVPNAPYLSFTDLPISLAPDRLAVPSQESS